MVAEYLTITAHSGCEGTLRDSMASVHTGILYGADVVEMDVRRDKSGSLVISHNQREEYSGCALLSEVFDAAQAGNVRVNCDIKETEIVHDVLALAARKRLGEQITLSGSVTPDLLKADPAIVRRAAVHLNIEELLKEYCVKRFPNAELSKQAPWDVVQAHQEELSSKLGELVEQSFTLGIQAVNLPYSGWARQLFSFVYTMGVPISVWTVNDQEDMERLISGGVLNLTTLNVRQALGVRKQLLGY